MTWIYNSAVDWTGHVGLVTVGLVSVVSRTWKLAVRYIVEAGAVS